MAGDQSVSREFEEAFDARAGSCCVLCACGRVHFDPDRSYSWEGGELERLLERSERDPDKVIAHDGSVGWLMIGGQQIVYGCPCYVERAGRFERFIVNHAEQIAEFLNARAARLRVEAANSPTVAIDPGAPQ